MTSDQRRIFFPFLLFCCLFCLFAPCFAQSKESIRLKELALEELLDLEITTASRKPQPLSSVASSVSILAPEQIRRSGATTFPDVLRLASGIHVIRSDSRTWGVSARGLNLNTANKLQVLMDGRILYTPLFGGVFWDVQDYVLHDIDRIEIIRGPGATLWGGNAVNGVINILTREARDTQGIAVEAGGGNEEKSFVSARYGNRIGGSTFYRGYFKFFNRDGLNFANGEDAQDDWLLARGGFRFDSDLSQTSTFTLQGDAYHGELKFPDREDGIVSGGNLLGRWSHLISENSDLQLHVYFDRNDRKIPLQFQEIRNTFDVDLQHRFQIRQHHDLVWGFNYRASADETEDNGTIRFEPKDRTIHHFSGFIQSDISLIQDRLIAIVGTKIEDNTFSGLELEPNFRIAWMADVHQTFWGAISRAVRVPSRLDTDLRFFPVSQVLTLRGNPDFKPEEVIAYELGYRVSPRSRIYLDITGFYNKYDSLITVEPGAPGEPSILGNGMNARIVGGTIATSYRPQSWLRLLGSVTFLSKDLELDPNSRDISNAAGEGNDPDHYWTFHAMIDAIRNFQVDIILRSSDDLPSPRVPGYVTMDLRLAWIAKDGLELSITAQNLLDDSHPEFGDPSPARKEVERSVYGKVTWFF